MSSSREKTQILAISFAKKILKEGVGKTARVCALQGDLGSGKTTFVQGFAKGLGITRTITSPTFLMIRRYPIPQATSHKPKAIKPLANSDQQSVGVVRSFMNFYHLDLYMINNPKEIMDLGFKEIISNPNNIICIEWAEKLGYELPAHTEKITFSYGKKENERVIDVKK